MQKFNNLFDFGEKSLTMEQATQCSAKFREVFEPLLADANVKIEERDGRITVKYHSIAKSSQVPKPFTFLQIIQACAGIENMIAVELGIGDVSECRSNSIAKFNQPNIGKFNKILDNAFNLFSSRLKAAHTVDIEQQEWDVEVEAVRKAVNHHKKTDDTSSYPHEYLGNIRGELHDDDADKNFRIELFDLTPQQVKKLGEVIRKF
jgi:hypothetical protein